MKTRFNLRLTVALICIFVGSLATSCANDWTLVRGDILGTGVAQTTLSDSLHVIWKFEAGKDTGFDATPVVDEGVIYIGDNAGKFHAIRLADGGEIWSKEFADGGFGAGAAVEKDRLYVGDMNGIAYCLATKDGKELWTKNLGGEVHAGPTLNGDDVLFTCEAGTLSCRRKADGNERWQFHIEAPLRCTPTISNGRAAVAGCDSHLHVIDVTDGSEKDSIEIDAPTGSTPAMRDDRVFFGTEGGTFYAISISATAGQKSSVAWTYHDDKRSQPIRTAAAVNDQIVVFGGQGKAIYALNRADGHEKWKLSTKTRIESSPVIAGNRVVAATTAGKIYSLDATSGEVKWEYDAGGSFIASPAVVDGKIILGNTDGTLYCLGGDGPAADHKK